MPTKTTSTTNVPWASIHGPAGAWLSISDVAMVTPMFLIESLELVFLPWPNTTVHLCHLVPGKSVDGNFDRPT